MIDVPVSELVVGVVPSVVEYVVDTPDSGSVGVRTTVCAAFFHPVPMAALLSVVTGAVGSAVTPKLLEAVRPAKS